MVHPRPLFHLLLVSFKQRHNFYTEQMWKMIHLVWGDGIQTHDLLIISLLPEPLDQGTSPLILSNRNYFKIEIKFGHSWKTWRVDFWITFLSLQRPDSSAGRASVFEQGEAAWDVWRRHAHRPRQGWVRVLARSHSHRHPRLRRGNQNRSLLLVRLLFCRNTVLLKKYSWHC